MFSLNIQGKCEDGGNSLNIEGKLRKFREFSKKIEKYSWENGEVFVGEGINIPGIFG
jgi:hypothetical protein